jgi:glycosyltransferase A (GT-A) superfamily protein (DUF2064 family)
MMIYGKNISVYLKYFCTQFCLHINQRGRMTEIHVVSFFGNWAVMISGKDTPVSTHNVKDEAIRIATQLSKRHNSRVIIEGDEGKGSEENP